MSGRGGHYGPGGGDGGRYRDVPREAGRGGHYGPGGGDGRRYSDNAGRDFHRGGGARGGGVGRGNPRVGRGPPGPTTPDLTKIKKVKTNSILANLTGNFGFYTYSTDARREDVPIDSVGRRNALFQQALFENFLAQETPERQRQIRDAVFFEGSFFFSNVAIQGLESENLPLRLLATPEGETFTVKRVFHFKAPKSMNDGNVEQAMGANVVRFELRCADCNSRFGDTKALIQHCKELDHMPAYDNADSDLLEPDESLFLQYCNVVLRRALNQRLARWGSEYIDPEHSTEPRDNRGNSLGITLYRAFSCDFNLVRSKLSKNINLQDVQNPVGKAMLTLTVDLRSKIIRSRTLLDEIYRGQRPHSLSTREQETLNNEWTGQVVIYKLEKKCYTVKKLRFDLSPDNHPVEGLGMSHTEYFAQRKGTRLQNPGATPMVEVLGRRNQSIYFPAELVCGNELDSRVREKLPQIASYRPAQRNSAVDEIMEYLPGEQSSRSLAACGIILQTGNDNRAKVVVAKATVMSVPELVSAGVRVEGRHKQFWAPALQKANFKVNPTEAVRLNVVLVHYRNIGRQGVELEIYGKIRDFVNSFQSSYQFPEQPFMTLSFQMGQGGDFQDHINVVENYLTQNTVRNPFVLDFMKPSSRFDRAYPILKKLLGEFGYLSQCVSFRTCDHASPSILGNIDRRSANKSTTILQGVARQILQKSGMRLWWVSLPKSLPLPTVFVGVDVFHSPREYDPQTRERAAKPSCAAIVVQVLRGDHEKSNTVEVYSETYRLRGGQEFGLEEPLRRTINNALTELDVNPMSCIVWRDGISDSSFGNDASDEIRGIRRGLNNDRSGAAPPPAVEQQGQTKDEPGLQPLAVASMPPQEVPISYIVCQKRIATKFLTTDGLHGAPPGTLVEGIQGLTHDTFYIQGRAPPFSTPKPVRYITIEQDIALDEVDMRQLTWDMSHVYPNWTGAVKVPSVCMCAHKLAMLAGAMSDSGDSIAHRQFKNRLHFL